jgi:serine/threonine protein kinase/SAM-dependent methyltransferase
VDAEEVRRYYETAAAAYARCRQGLGLSEEIARFRARLPSGARVLDLGCGPGRDLRDLEARGCRTVGLDVAPAMLREAHAAGARELVLGDLRQLPFAAGCADGIWASASVIFLEKWELPGFLGECRRILRERGILFVSVKRGEQTLRRTDAFGSRAEQRYGREELERALEAGGFRVLECWETPAGVRHPDPWVSAIAERGGGDRGARAGGVGGGAVESGRSASGGEVSASRTRWLPGSAAGGDARRPGSDSGLWAPGEMLLDAYRVVGLLGCGGMGRVYEVRHVRTGLGFAVKTLMSGAGGDAGSRRRMLREIETWIDLRPHPHLTACHFFRTLGERLLVFAELVDGGSLAQGIDRGRLGDPAVILDLAIQAAWGLAAARAQGVVHQDVKPGNILVTREGVAKITDFGLARAGMVFREGAGGGVAAQGGAGASMAAGATSVVAQGLTPAFCSPEQARALAGEGAAGVLGPATDIWSFGLTILAMFTGGVHWLSGLAAPEVLALRTGRRGPRMGQGIPGPLVEILERCFAEDPSARWESAGRLAEELARAYRGLTGRPYPRPVPELSGRESTGWRAVDRRTRTGFSWHPPEFWLERARRIEAGAVAGSAVEAGAARTRRAGLIAELAEFERCQEVFEGLAARRGGEITPLLARLLYEKGLIHEAAKDFTGAVQSFRRVGELLAGSEAPGGRRSEARLLAMAWMSTADALHASGKERASIQPLDRAIALLERLADEGDPEAARDLGRAWINRAVTLVALGDLATARSNYARGIQCLLALARTTLDAITTRAITVACMNLANLEYLEAHHAEARDHAERALAWMQLWREFDDSPSVLDVEAGVLLALATATKHLGDVEAAYDLYVRAAWTRERLIRDLGRDDLEVDLAIALSNIAITGSELGRLEESLGAIERAEATLERVVDLQNNVEHAPVLAQTMAIHAELLSQLGRYEQAVATADRSIRLMEAFLEEKPSRLLLAELIWAYRCKGEARMLAGDTEQAMEILQYAVGIAPPGPDSASDPPTLGEEHARTMLGLVEALIQAEHFAEAHRVLEELREVLRSLARRGQTLLAVNLRMELAVAEILPGTGREGEARRALRELMPRLERASREYRALSYATMAANAAALLRDLEARAGGSGDMLPDM